MTEQLRSPVAAARPMGDFHSETQRVPKGELPPPLSALELRQRMDERRDEQPLTVSCSIPGCDWSFEGTAGAARERAIQHRELVHPDLTPQRRRDRDVFTGTTYRMVDSDGRYGCKIDGCNGRSRTNRGAYAYLCDDHVEGQRDLVSDRIKTAVRAKPIEPARISPARPPAQPVGAPRPAVFDAIVDQIATLEAEAERLQAVADEALANRARVIELIDAIRSVTT